MKRLETCSYVLFNIAGYCISSCLSFVIADHATSVEDAVVLAVKSVVDTRHLATEFVAAWILDDPLLKDGPIPVEINLDAAEVRARSLLPHIP